MPDIDRVRAAAREWLAFVGDVDSSPVVVPFGDPNGDEQAARYRLARVLRDELFEPTRRGPLYVWSGEGPLEGQRQHWGGPDIWKCDEHPDWQGEEYGTWESYRDFVAGDARQARRPEADVRREWERESMEAHAAFHGVEIGQPRRYRRDEVSDADNGAFRLGAGEGQRLWAFGDLMILKLTAEQTSGRVFVMEQHVPRHRRAPGRHVHEVDDQSWFVIAGRGRWFIGDQTIDAGPGDFVHGPHGVAHAFSADSDDLQVLVITAPAGLEGFFAAVGVEATKPTHPPADLPEAHEDPDLARRYGTTALGPEPRWTPKE